MSGGEEEEEEEEAREEREEEREEEQRAKLKSLPSLSYFFYGGFPLLCTSKKWF